MYDVYDYGVVTHTHTHTRARARATCDNLPREIYDNLTQRHFFYLQPDYRRHVSDIDIVDQLTC